MENRIITAVFNGFKNTKVSGVWQWDYGQILRIQGLDLPTAVEVDFAVAGASESIARIGTTKDGVTDVVIPDSLIETGKNLVAYIFLRDSASGNTEYQIDMLVTKRAKPEAYNTPEDKELFGQAVEAVNTAADRAEKAGQAAQEAAQKAGLDAEQTAQDRVEVAKMVETVTDISEQVKKVEELSNKAQESATQAGTSATAAEKAKAQAETAAGKTAEDRIAVNQAKIDVDEVQKAVRADRAAVEEAKQSVEQLSNAIPESTQVGVQAVNQAKQTAVNEIARTGTSHKTAVEGAGTQAVESVENVKASATEAVETAKTEAVQSVQTEGNTQTGNVTTEGTKQVKAVQAAAQEIAADREQIQKNAESVTALKEDLHMITSVGKNLFNPSTLVDGYLNADGSIHENGIDMDWSTTDFIEVEPEKKIVTSKKSNDGIRRKITMFFLTEFDAGKKVIKHTVSSEKHVIDLLENSKFVRFSIHKAEINEIQTEQNNDMTTYEPYEKKVGKDNLSREFVEEFEALKRLKWQGKKWACLGDSLTEKNIRTTKHYHDYIAESTGIAVFNMGVGGTGYKRTEENYTAFYQRAVKLPVDCDVVTIFGSGNDLSLIKQLGTPTDVETTTICGCINKTIDEIIKIKPTVALGIVSPTPWVGNQPTVDDSNAMAKYTKALHDICKIRSIPFLDLYHCSNLRPWTSEGRNACYTKDDGNGVHPDENGHKLIAPRFKIFLEQLII